MGHVAHLKDSSLLGPMRLFRSMIAKVELHRQQMRLRGSGSVKPSEGEEFYFETDGDVSRGAIKCAGLNAYKHDSTDSWLRFESTECTGCNESRSIRTFLIARILTYNSFVCRAFRHPWKCPSWSSVMSLFATDEEFEAYLAKQAELTPKVPDSGSPKSNTALTAVNRLNEWCSYIVPALLLLGIGAAYWSFTGKVGHALKNPDKLFLKATGNEDMEAKIKASIAKSKESYRRSMEESARVRQNALGL